METVSYKKTMENMKDGDILLYLDSFYKLNTRNFDEYFEIIKNDYIIGTTNCIENEWCKADLIIKLNMIEHKYLDTSQHQAGAILFLVCDKTRKLVNEWYEIGTDYHLIDDSKSYVKNLHCFKEHRHDQSIFSLLTKKYNLFSKYSLKDSIVLKRNIE